MIKYINIVVILLLFTSCSENKKKFTNKQSVEIALVDVVDSLHYQKDIISGFKYANKKYKYLDNGTEIKYKIYNSINDENSTNELFKTMKNRDTKAIISLSDSEKTMKNMEIINKTEVPYISVVGTYDELISKSPYITRVSTSNEKIGNIGAYYIIDELRGKKVSLIYNSKNVYSKSIFEAFNKKFSQLNGNVDAIIDIGINEFSENLVNESNVIFLALNSSNKYKYIKELKKIDEDFKIITTEGLYNYMLSTKPDEMSVVDDVVTIEQFKVFKSKSVFKLFDEQLFTNSVYALLGYESYILLHTALNKCPQLTTVCINRNLRNSNDILGAIESLKTIDGHTQRTLFINTIKDDNMVNNLIVH